MAEKFLTKQINLVGHTRINFFVKDNGRCSVRIYLPGWLKPITASGYSNRQALKIAINKIMQQLKSDNLIVTLHSTEAHK